MLVTFLLAVINIYIAWGYVWGDTIVPTNSESIWRVWIGFVFHMFMGIYFLLAIKAASVVVQ